MMFSPFKMRIEKMFVTITVIIIITVNYYNIVAVDIANTETQQQST